MPVAPIVFTFYSTQEVSEVSVVSGRGVPRRTVAQGSDAALRLCGVWPAQPRHSGTGGKVNGVQG